MEGKENTLREIINDTLKIRIESLIINLNSTLFQYDNYKLRVKFKGINNRFKKGDVDDIQVDELKEEIILSLNRPGIYDYLPKALFHSYYYGDKKNSYKELVELNYKEEKRIRNYFEPISSAFFNLLLLIETYENDLLSFEDVLYGNLFSLPHYWKKEHKIRLYNVAPFLKKAKGNKDLIVFILKSVLKVGKIEIKEQVNYESITNKHNTPKLGAFHLGNDNLHEKTYNFGCNKWHLTIGPILAEKYYDRYFEMGIATRIARDICHWLLPYEVEFAFQYLISKESQICTLNEAPNNILGLTTYL